MSNLTLNGMIPSDDMKREISIQLLQSKGESIIRNKIRNGESLQQVNKLVFNKK